MIHATDNNERTGGTPLKTKKERNKALALRPDPAVANLFRILARLNGMTNVGYFEMMIKNASKSFIFCENCGNIIINKKRIKPNNREVQFICPECGTITTFGGKEGDDDKRNFFSL